MKRNRYSRVIEILKSTKINESLPTNHTKGLYTLNDPGFRVGQKDPAKVYYPDVDGNWPAGIPGTPGELEYVRPEGYWSGGSDWQTQISTDFSQDYLLTDPTGRSTDTLIGEDGTVFSELPPGGESFILGPIVDGFVPNHTYDAYTNIGYIQKDTRQFVLLARISGQWKSDLNGSYPTWGGTSTGLTIYNENFTLEMAQWIRDKILADSYVVNVPYFYSGGVPQRPQDPAQCPNCPPNMYGGNGIGPRQFGSGGNPNIGTQQPAPRSGDSADANLWGLTANRYMPRGGDFGPSLKPDGTSGFPKPGEMNKGSNGQWYEYTPGAGWTPIPSMGSGLQSAHYTPNGNVLSESRKRILREIKNPVVVPEPPKKYKMNFAGKYSAQNTPDKTSSKISDDLVASGNARGQRWRLQDKYWQGYETTERMNIVYDKVGHGDQYWEEIINENKRKKTWKTKEMQEHLNIMVHEKVMKEENPNYESPFYKQFIDEQETLKADKDPLFKKISNRLKKEIDYSDKPSKNGVPDNPPPEMVNGYHPNYGKRKDYYKKLDPQSAEAMPLTGDAETDAQIKAARKNPK